jgi:hypothetical protein
LNGRSLASSIINTSNNDSQLVSSQAVRYQQLVCLLGESLVKSPITSSIKLLKMSFLLGWRMLEQLEVKPIWSKTKFFIFSKRFMLTSKQHLWVLPQRDLLSNKKISMFKIGKENIRKFGFPHFRHMIFYY